ncbi:hypothetical protein EYF80_046409 [Liparis tanakae]|uniref:Uncharacterized protein n=1 Tax=Liparis tanakae TaxID=230148 RepID=A0A4Z2FR48_9TELE|nr:hypothetical protein EYF80_046409 [Liparis tanakae]
MTFNNRVVPVSGSGMFTLIDPVGNFFSTLDPSLLIKEQRAAVKQLEGLSALLKGFNMNYGDSGARTGDLVVSFEGEELHRLRNNAAKIQLKPPHRGVGWTWNSCIVPTAA